MLDRYAYIRENLILFEEEKKQRMANPFYRIQFNFYKFKKWVKTWIQ